MRPKQQLISAVKSSSKLENFFIKFERNYETKANTRYKSGEIKDFTNSKLSEILQELSRAECLLFWKDISKLCQDNLQVFASLCDCNSNSEDEKVAIIEAVNRLESISTLCLAAVKAPNLLITDELMETVFILHGSLLNFTSFSSKLAEIVSNICIEWWCRDLQCKHDLSLNVLVFLFNEILGTRISEKKLFSKLINQLQKMQNALFSTDLLKKKDESVSSNNEMLESLEELRHLLTAAFLHPAFLNVKNGRKFLSNVLLLDQDLLIMIHQSIISQISVNHCYDYCNAYGNIYYLAWSQADDVMKEKVEEYCIQDVMFKVIHVPHDKGLFHAYHQILLSITCQNGALQVRHMLTRLYNPIIWRSLKASNAMVRANAASLLFDTFPMVNAGDNLGEERDAFLQKQFTAIEDLLMDPYPQVRTIAVTGIFNILNLFWDVIPAHVIAVQCRNLYTNLAFDACTTVRLAVFQGTIVLLNNPCSHPILKKLLPVVSRCIHDCSEKVRIAVCKVLLSVKKTSTIKYWEVCPVENILSQLAVEGRAGSNVIVRLITGSFLPQDQPVQAWIERCVNFYSRSTDGARKFYLFAKDQLSAMELGEFIFMLSVFIFNCVSKSFENEAQEQINPDQSSTNIAENSSAVAGLLDTICILWLDFSGEIKSVSKRSNGTAGGDKPSSELRELAKKVMVQLPRMTHVCFRKYHDGRTLNALLHLSSCLNPASMPIFSKKVIPKLRSLPDDSPSSYYSMLVKCVVKWRWSKDLLVLINDWLAPAFNQNDLNHASRGGAEPHTKELKKTKRKAKCVMFDEPAPTPPNPVLAIKYLQVLLDNEESFLAVLSDVESRKLLVEISFHLQAAATDLTRRISGKEGHIECLTDKSLLDCIHLLLTLLTCLHLFFQTDCGNQTSHTPHKSHYLDYLHERSHPKSDESKSEADVYLQRIKNVIETSQIDLIGQLKSTVQVAENTSMLSMTIVLDQSLQSNSSSSSRLLLIKDALQLIFSSSLRLIKAGLPVADNVLCFLSAFTQTGVRTIDHVSSVCPLLRELVDYFLLFSWSPDDPGRSKQVEEESLALTQVVDDVIAALLMHSRKNPDGFREIFRSQLRSDFRSIFLTLSHYSLEIVVHLRASLVMKMLSVILADITYHKGLSGHQSYETTSDLSPFSIAMLSVVCVTSTDCNFICSILPNLFSDYDATAEDQKQDLAVDASVHLLQALSSDGKFYGLKDFMEEFKQKYQKQNVVELNET